MAAERGEDRAMSLLESRAPPHSVQGRGKPAPMKPGTEGFHPSYGDGTETPFSKAERQWFDTLWRQEGCEKPS